MAAITLDRPAGRLLADERESLREELRTIGMVREQEIIRFSRTLSSFIQPVLFLFRFVLGYGIGSLVGATAGFGLQKFLFPGIVAMTVMSTAVSSPISIVWDREFGFRFGYTLLDAVNIGITCVFAAVFLALAVTGFGAAE
jgi:hypothetical protein